MDPLDLTLDRDHEQPLRTQLVTSIRARIESGEWAPGTRLPSSRDLAQRLGVNRTTVVQGYADLADAGLVDSTVGRGTFVRQRQESPPAAATDRAAAGGDQPLAWDAFLSRSRALPQGAGPALSADAVVLHRAVGHPTLFPLEEIAAATRRVFESRGRELLAYPSPAGYEPLRAALRARLAKQGVAVDRNELLIVNGSQQGLDLVARLLLADGGTVVTARPSFSGALDVFRWWRATLQGVPAGADGLDDVALERALASPRTRLCYVVADRANPTGATLSVGARARLLERVQAARVPLLEDDWLAELRADGEAPPLKAHDRQDQVLYLGTFSKVLAPGLRLGWLMVPKPLFAPLLALKRVGDLATNFPAQAALHELLRSGFIDRHVRDLRQQFERRARIVDAAFDRHFPAGIRPRRPHSGMVCWIDLPARTDIARVVDDARRAGIEISPGAPFDPATPPAPALRLSYSAAGESALEPAIAALGKLLTRHLRDGADDGAPPLV
jgi:GntR family transcriptional regulator/MocR family aminotransferase